MFQIPSTNSASIAVPVIFQRISEKRMVYIDQFYILWAVFTLVRIY
jgi:hypothetical protein